MKMQSLKNGLIVGAGLMVFTLVGTVMNNGRSADAARAADLGPTVTIAGPLPVPIRNSDEKGRIPYQQSGGTGCNTGLCDLAFPSVPAGKRLVIEHVSANVNPNPGIGVIGVFLEGASGFSYWSLPGHSLATPELVSVNEQVLAYFESGEIPFVRVAWNSPTTNTGAFQAVISGYLVDLNP